MLKKSEKRTSNIEEGEDVLYISLNGMTKAMKAGNQYGENRKKKLTREQRKND